MRFATQKQLNRRKIHKNLRRIYDRDHFDYHNHTSNAGAARAGRNKNAGAGSYQGAAACVPLPCALWNESGMILSPSWTTGNTGGRGGGAAAG